MTQTHDAQGREVFTVHPQILAGGAPYRRTRPGDDQQDAVQDGAPAQPAQPEKP